MELEAACEQYRRALETNTINQEQVSKMSAKFMELHVKVRAKTGLGEWRDVGNSCASLTLHAVIFFGELFLTICGQYPQVANLEAACDRYRLQEEEWQNKLNQSDGQARVILVMSEQVSVSHLGVHAGDIINDHAAQSRHFTSVS